jgi:hypothetical protein
MVDRNVSLADLQATAASALAAYHEGGDDVDRTALLKRTAATFVWARRHFFTQEGEPDWTGRTNAYRRWVRETMAQAHIPSSEAPTIQAAVRYHSGAALREQLTAEQIEELGLRPESPRERSVEKRERYSETLSIFGAGGHELVDAEEIVNAARMMEAALRRVSIPAVGALPAGKRREVGAAVERVNGLAEAIVDAANGSRVRK